MLEITWSALCSGLAIALSLLLLVFFKDLRTKFKIGVNCWFCNENASVPFAERNGFVCPSCRQYNGFEKDGGYNKAIPEQYDEMLNPHRDGLSKKSKQPAKNGLCKLCNNNQQLKVYQLANFVPMDEDNYDVEIEHFQKQLEKAYKLCPKCDVALKKTIHKQNSWMLGVKLKYLKQRGAGALDASIRELSEVQKSHLIFSSLFLFSVSALYFSGYLKRLLQAVLTDAPQRLCENLRVYGFHDAVDVLRASALPFYEGVTGKNEIVLSWICAIVLLLSVIYIIHTTKTAVKQSTAKPTAFKYVNASRHERILQESYSDNEIAHSNCGPLIITDLSSDNFESDSEIVVKKRKKKQTHKTNRTMPVFGEKASFKQSSFTDLNESFTTVKSYNCFNNSDLNVSLNNLKLGYARPKQLIAPGKLKNPWTGRFWDADTVSRSSSQSSGFCSYNSADNCGSGANSICGEFECSSMISGCNNLENKFGSMISENKFRLSNAVGLDNRSIMSGCNNFENKFRPSNLVGLDNRNIMSGGSNFEDKFRPLKVGPDNSNTISGCGNLDNKFRPLNVGLDNKSIFSCSTNIYRPAERSLFSGDRGGFRPVVCNPGFGSVKGMPVSLYNSTTGVHPLDFQGQYSPKNVF